MGKLKMACLILIMFIVSSCGPLDTVIDGVPMVVYYKESTVEDNKIKNIYYIKDNSKADWRFYTDKEFQIGDTVEVVIKTKKTEKEIVNE